MNRRRPLAVTAALVGALALGACSTTDVDPDVAAPGTQEGTPSSSVPPVVTSEPAPAVPTTPAPVRPTTKPTPTASPAAPQPTYDLKAVQTQLATLKYYLGEPDGEAGLRTSSAVQAFQKVNGLSPDGAIGPKTLAALKAPKAPRLRGGIPDRVEVDLTKQVLYVVKDDAIQRILPVSSGSGEVYFQKDGDRATSLTPTGFFRIERRIIGLREADLGTLYDPQYFYKGWAIHGSNSVPGYPASHGCVRVTRTDAKWLLEAIDVGMGVYLYGGTHTFESGSPAPGTDNPTGDEDTTPTAKPTPTAATPTPTRSVPVPTTTAPAPVVPVPTTTTPAPVTSFAP